MAKKMLIDEENTVSAGAVHFDICSSEGELLAALEDRKANYKVLHIYKQPRAFVWEVIDAPVEKDLERLNHFKEKNATTWILVTAAK
jgi:hypothetical protein